MSDNLQLPVTYKGEELMLDMQLQRWGYINRLLVLVHGAWYIYEPDEEGLYRVLVPEDLKQAGRDLGLLKTIGETLDELMK
jgi:hypothetical protein